jgi:hypothetical protein
MCDSHLSTARPAAMDLQLHMRFCQSQRDLTYSLHMSSRKIMRRDRSDVHSSPRDPSRRPYEQPCCPPLYVPRVLSLGACSEVRLSKRSGGATRAAGQVRGVLQVGGQAHTAVRSCAKPSKERGCERPAVDVKTLGSSPLERSVLPVGGPKRAMVCAQLRHRRRYLDL